MKRGTEKYRKNWEFLKSYVGGENCYCDFGLFCENAMDMYGKGFIDKLYACDSEQEVIDLVHTII